MKLQKQFAYEYEGTKHFKYIIILPEKIIKKLNWEEGENLVFKTTDGKRLMLEPGIIEPKKEKMPYDKFKEIIKKKLEETPSGLTWTQIKNKTELKQKVPNNKWVKMMCKDIGLKREKTDRKTVWRLK